MRKFLSGSRNGMIWSIGKNITEDVFLSGHSDHHAANPDQQSRSLRGGSMRNGALTRLYERLEHAPGHAPEFVALGLYVVLLCVISAFHEPWFDEAQAWQIARCAPINDILFVIPHFEGHPPLWHLLLYLPAKLGAPYEWSIKALNILICSAAVCVLLFRSPFPRSIRIILPFTYFLFYQYGAIARPYSLLFLSFMLAAAVYSARDRKPFRYVAVLILLCLSSAYGIVFAGGLAVVWLIEIVRSFSLHDPVVGFLRDKRIRALALLLLIAVVNILLIRPYPDAYAVSLITPKNSFPVRLLYTVFILPADASFFDCFNVDAGLASEPFLPGMFAAGLVLGLLFWAALLFFSRRKKNTLLLVLPYALFAVFSALVYFSQHHIGVVSLFLLFWFWVDTGSPDMQALPDPDGNASRLVKRAEFAHALRVLCAVLILSVSVIWTITASCLDITNVYGFGRDAAAVLKERKLEDLRVFCSWGEQEDPIAGKTIVDTNYTAGVTILPYFDHNILYNLNLGSDSLAYMTHRRANEAANKANFRAWAAKGAPDVLLGWVNLPAAFGDELTMNDYTPIARLQQGMIWKMSADVGFYSIYQKIG